MAKKSIEVYFLTHFKGTIGVVPVAIPLTFTRPGLSTKETRVSLRRPVGLHSRDLIQCSQIVHL